MKKILTILFSFTICLGLNAAVFTSIASGNYTASSTWSFVGSDADGIPDNNDDVTIASPHTVTIIATSDCKSLVINAGGKINLNSQVFRVYGSLTNNGTSVGAGQWQFRAIGTYSGNPINNNGSIYFYNNYTIAPGVVLNKGGVIIVGAGVTVVNNGNITLTLSGNLHIYPYAVWKNNPGSSVNVSGNVINAGTLDCSAASNNFVYSTNATTSVEGTNATYYNLILNATSANTKTLTANITVLHNLTINSFVKLDWGAKNIALGGNWTNNADINTINIGTITFNGSGIQNITRSTIESFKGMTFSGTGTVNLMTDINARATTTLTSGTLDPNTFTFHQKGASWLNNGGSINTLATGKVIFDGGISQTIGGSATCTFGNFEINNPGFTVSLSNDAVGAGTSTLTAGIFDPASFIWHQQGATWSANGGTINTGASGEIIFDGAIAQSIGGSVGATFGKLEISSSNTVTLARVLNVAGIFTLTSGTLDVSASNFAVNLSGNFVHNGGIFTFGTGTVTANGTSLQTFSGVAATGFYNLTSNNTLGGVTVTRSIVINNILQVNSSSFGTSGSGSIILTANGATTYARIGTLGAGASLFGTNWTIRSYINGPATAYWQYLGPPVSGTTLADWDNDYRFYMSGVGGNDGNACCPVFYSVRTYNTPTNTYTNITSVSTALVPCRGYMVWMADNLNSLTAPLPFDTKGTPNQGTVVRAVTAGGAGAGYNLVSNPYACPINYASVVASSGILNPNFLILQENGSYVTNPNGGVIAPAQGFMCIATANGNMKVLETAKNTAASPNIIRESAPQNSLTIISGNGTNGLGGSAVVQINSNAHNGYDADFDMPYLPSPYDDATNIWTTDNEGKDLLLNALDGTNDVLDIPLSVVSGTPGNQLLSFRGINSLESYSCAWIENLATGEKINLKDHDTYSFMANGAGEKHDFNIHLERTANCPLSEQNITASLDASSLVFVNNGNILVKFAFEEKTDVTIAVFDVAGKEVNAEKNVTVTNETIPLDNPGAHGIYLVRISKGTETVTRKIYL
jgi:hypothetical protein